MLLLLHPSLAGSQSLEHDRDQFTEEGEARRKECRTATTDKFAQDDDVGPLGDLLLKWTVLEQGVADKARGTDIGVQPELLT